MKKMRIRRSKLFKNKMTALAVLGLGYIPVLIDGTGTPFIMLAMIAVPLFFAKENYIN